MQELLPFAGAPGDLAQPPRLTSTASLRPGALGKGSLPSAET